MVRLNDDSLRLLDAGNPIGLMQNTVRLTSPFRDGDDSRMSEYGPSKLDLNTYASFRGLLAFESRPAREPSSPEQTRASERLEYTAVAGVLVGLAVFAWVTPIPANVPVKVAALVLPWLCVSMLQAAFRLRNTFRFRSDLVAIWYDGSYQFQKGGLNGSRSVEVGLVKSDITAVIVGSRVVSECTLGHGRRGRGRRPRDRRPVNVQAGADATSTLKSDRYLIRTEVDELFLGNMEAIAAAVKQHRDAFRDVVGLNQDSPEAVRVVQANVQAEREQEVFKHQLQIKRDLMAKAVEGLTPDQAAQVLATGEFPPPPPVRPTPALPPPAATAPPPPSRPPGGTTSVVPPAVVKKLSDAMRVYYGPGQTDDARQLAKQMIDQLKSTHRLSSELVDEVARRVRAELGVRG